jgi:hypothetical protein
LADLIDTASRSRKKGALLFLSDTRFVLYLHLLAWPKAWPRLAMFATGAVDEYHREPMIKSPVTSL